MLLLLRHVSSNNSSHPQGYLRKVLAKPLACFYDLQRTVPQTDRGGSELLWVPGVTLPEFWATQCLGVKLGHLVSVVMNTGTCSARLSFGRGADKFPRKTSHVSKPEQESKARSWAVVVQNKKKCLWQELTWLMLMNFFVLLIAFCDINAILYGSTITQERNRNFFGLYVSQSRSQYVPMSQFKVTKFLLYFTKMLIFIWSGDTNVYA